MIRISKTELNRIRALDFIEKEKSQCDFVNHDGIVYGHISNSYSKEELGKLADQIRSLLPEIKFTMQKTNSLNKNGRTQTLYDLYGDYYKFWGSIKSNNKSNITTKVIDIHKRNGKRPNFDLYMGRTVFLPDFDSKGNRIGSHIHPDFPKDSIWHNPYSYEEYGPECLELFEKYLRNNKVLLNKLPSLKGKLLGCWCSDQAKCHVGIIIKIMIERGIING